MRATVVAFTSDWRFGPHHSAALAAGLRERGARHAEERVLETDAGHDAFLLDVPGYADVMRAALAWPAPTPSSAMRSTDSRARSGDQPCPRRRWR